MSSRRTATHRGVRNVAAALAMTLFAVGAAGAAELRVLSAAAMQSVFGETLADFERASGQKVVMDYGTIGGTMQRVLKGETPDVFIGSTLSMPALEKAGRIRSGSAVTLCKVAIAMVVPTGTPKPPLASVDDFKRAVMGAKVLVYADPARGGAAGVHVGRTLEKLGLARELRMPVVLAAGGDITEVTLAQGVGAVGITQASEIVGKPGAEYVGALPPALQNYTVFVAAVPADAPASSAASAFMAFLRSPAVIAVIRAKGMDVD